ncbi:MAG: DUF402 domain-containing protein [Oscillospiraceae bacterium]|nr:DUF402 domain-containing protein [Oscillospiraceae bacterium]
MNKKRLTREKKMGFQHFPYYQMRIECGKFHGWAAFNDLTDGEYLYWDFFEKAGRVPIAGKGMCWLTLIPDGKKRSVTAMFTEDEKVSAWYIDIIDSVVTDDDGVLAFWDKYLDVMLTTSGDVIIDDRDELDSAYRSGEFTKEEYEAAVSEGQRIIDELAGDIHATEAVCREMLQYVKARVNERPLTVFLDIDGVLNIFDPDAQVQTILPCAGENICELVHRMKAKVVVISSHRLGGKTWDMLQEFFKRNNINDVDITPWGEEYSSRTEEINAYLQMHPNIERYVILGDCFQDDYSRDPNLRNRLVFVDALKGLQKQDIIKACEILNRQNSILCCDQKAHC